ncbi:MAG: hypothetical protein J2P37_05205 [Ktedonobacteraceae bacterium]|nr:hypothetical protein [Ktedonobacteraceae bacterium]
MSFQIYIKTDKSLRQLAKEMRELLSLPPFTQSSHAGETYCQFEMFGMLVLLRRSGEEEQDPEVSDFPYCFDMQMTFSEHELDTDELEYQLQPYYAQLLAFHLHVETAHLEKQKAGEHWQVRYQYYRKNPQWNSSILYGEQGWQPAILPGTPSKWRRFTSLFH